MLDLNKKVKIALIADELTDKCLQYEADIFYITPLNYKLLLYFFKPDFLFVESAWHGKRNAWKFKIASYPEYPKRNNKALQKVVAYAKNLNIPTVFWNKEDGVHFERFIESAKLFDHILTVDENCIPLYQANVPEKVTVNSMMFAVQTSIHYPTKGFKYPKACFLGSYSHHIHNRRRQWQDILFQASSHIGLDVYDRNSKRKAAHYRFPKMPGLQVFASVPHEQTAKIYRDYMISLNINTIEDSKTMFSRRLIEILACGGIAVTNPSPAVEKYFKDYCYVVNNADEADKLLERFKNGPTKEDYARALAGSKYVLEHHTWSHRLNDICKIIGLVR
ncbi:MAG: glycosyltransferase [Sulfuricurvum sp.]|nr:glycosyltransferase [Sulfuricurvum sp.]